LRVFVLSCTIVVEYVFNTRETVFDVYMYIVVVIARIWYAYLQGAKKHVFYSALIFVCNAYIRMVRAFVWYAYSYDTRIRIWYARSYDTRILWYAYSYDTRMIRVRYAIVWYAYHIYAYDTRIIRVSYVKIYSRAILQACLLYESNVDNPMSRKFKTLVQF
jgi:hypothetical protein